MDVCGARDDYFQECGIPAIFGDDGLPRLPTPLPPSYSTALVAQERAIIKSTNHKNKLQKQAHF